MPHSLIPGRMLCMTNLNTTNMMMTNTNTTPNEHNEYNEHGYPKEFKFDWTSWQEWLEEAIKDIYENINIG